jgi:hypothetical protein
LVAPPGSPTGCSRTDAERKPKALQTLMFGALLIAAVLPEPVGRHPQSEGKRVPLRGGSGLAKRSGEVMLTPLQGSRGRSLPGFVGLRHFQGIAADVRPTWRKSHPALERLRLEVRDQPAARMLLH